MKINKYLKSPPSSNGWNTKLSIGIAFFFQGQAVRFRECNPHHLFDIQPLNSCDFSRNIDLPWDEDEKKHHETLTIEKKLLNL